MNTAIAFEAERQAMVEQQLRSRDIRSERVLEAMARVPRHEFVPPPQVPAAYDDRALPIGPWETISQPYIVALMTEAAAVRPGDHLLEIGTGAGYQAAVLAYLGARVYTIERNANLADEARQRLARLGYGSAVTVITGDGSQGHPEAAPYDAILVTAASPRVPQALLDQLADGGRLVIPVGSRLMQQLRLIVKAGERTIDRTLTGCQFVPLVGKEGWSESADEALPWQWIRW
ncbi:MAG TPA: protein-L-isoaspartate(D-aspartate) O-methyltransferase [Terriglobia bacterium]|nr:protein-L-isoaspartate(D-aspartate) O-methyltransferase [Terriglobia bacterium]